MNVGLLHQTCWRGGVCLKCLAVQCAGHLGWGEVGVTRDGALGSQGAQPRSGHCGMRSGRSLVAVARGVLGERDPDRLGNTWD